MRELIKKESLEARFINGVYFKELILVFKKICLTKSKSFSIRDKYILGTYFLGNQFAANKLYSYLRKKYKEKEYFNFNGILFPDFSSLQYKNDFLVSWLEIIYPYLYNEYIYFFGEGPYLYKNIQIKKNDIVIDAGANLGLFSALASFLGGVVYAFEPVKKIRKDYLEQAVKLNKNIFPVFYGLSNKKESIKIIGGSIVGATIMKEKQKNLKSCIINEYIQVTTLDKWVKENNVPRVDFIKADIEGAERLMLEGAQWVLKTFSPQLSICTYHLPDDKEVLSKLILQANPSYKIIYKPKKIYAFVKRQTS